MDRPLVYLFRTRTEPDPYERALEVAGFEAVCYPVLQFESINSRELRERLAHPRNYSGFILTSPRAVNALSEAMAWLPTENVLRHARSIFAVGPRTASELRDIGFEPVGEESGSAGRLADEIRRHAFDKPLLFLCGDRRRDELPEQLQQADIPFEELAVYRTIPEASRALSEAPAPDWMVFFSPSGIEAVESTGVLGRVHTRLAAIGSTTADALRAMGGDVEVVAPHPTPQALAQALSAAAGR